MGGARRILFLLAFFARKLAMAEKKARECEIRDARNPNPRDLESIHLIGNESQIFRISLAQVQGPRERYACFAKQLRTSLFRELKLTVMSYPA